MCSALTNFFIARVFFLFSSLVFFPRPACERGVMPKSCKTSVYGRRKVVGDSNYEGVCLKIGVWILTRFEEKVIVDGDEGNFFLCVVLVVAARGLD